MTNPKRPTLGDVIRAARLDLRFSQSDFASRLAISRRTLLRWETNVTTPDEYAILALLRAVHGFDPVLAIRVAQELGVAPLRGPEHEVLTAALVAAAESSGVPQERLRAALGALVVSWRQAGATLDDVARALAP